MLGKVGSVFDRLKEPGSIRSLAVILFALRGLMPATWQTDFVSPDQVENFITALIAVLGATSFLMPDKAKVVVAVENSAAALAVSKVDALVQDVTAPKAGA